MGQRRSISRSATARRWAIDIAMLVGMGLLMGFLGPFDSNEASVGTRYLYWTICMVGGGLIAFAVEDGLKLRLRDIWVRVAAASALATPLVTLFVLTTQYLLFDQGFRWIVYGQLLWQVCPIMLAAITVRAPGLATVAHTDRDADRRRRASAGGRGRLPAPAVGETAWRAADRGRGARPLPQGAHRRGRRTDHPAVCRRPVRTGAGARLARPSLVVGGGRCGSERALAARRGRTPPARRPKGARQPHLCCGF